MAAGGSELTSQSNEILNIRCSPCAEENRRREAEKYCLDCKDYYCLSCFGLHRRLPALRTHKVLDKHDSGTLRPDQSLPCYPTQRCVEHHLEVVTMFCKDHDEVACPSCIALSHRTCKTVVVVAEHAEEIHSLHQIMSPNDTKKQVTKMKKEMSKIKNVREIRLQKVKEELQKEITSVKAHRKKLDALLDNAEKATIEELKRESGKLQDSIMNEIQLAEGHLNALEETSKLLEKSEGNSAQEFVSIKSFQRENAKAKDTKRKLAAKLDKSVGFSADKTVTDFLQQTKMLGDIFVGTMQSVSPLIKDCLYTVKGQRAVNVKLGDETTCSIRGMCMMEEDCLVLADTDNEKLKRIHLSRGRIQDFVKLQGLPLALCLVDRTECAVALLSNAVQFVSLGDQMTTTRTLKLNHRCFGLACKGEKLFISDKSKTVYIHDMNGQEIKRVSKDSSGKDLFTDTRHITLSITEGNLLVADVNKGLIVLDDQGNLKSNLVLSSLPGTHLAVGVTVCTDGRNIFLGGPKGIFQLRQDLNVLGSLGNGEGVISLCFDYYTSCLVVASFCKNEIAILELEQTG